MQPFVLRRLAQGQWHLFGPPVTWRRVDTHSCCEFLALHHMSIHQPGLDNCGIGHTGPCRTCTNGSPCNMAHFWGSSWPSVTANRACPGSLIYLWWSCPGSYRTFPFLRESTDLCCRLRSASLPCNSSRGLLTL